MHSRSDRFSGSSSRLEIVKWALMLIEFQLSEVEVHISRPRTNLTRKLDSVRGAWKTESSHPCSFIWRATLRPGSYATTAPLRHCRESYWYLDVSTAKRSNCQRSSLSHPPPRRNVDAFAVGHSIRPYGRGGSGQRLRRKGHKCSPSSGSGLCTLRSYECQCKSFTSFL